MDGLQNTLGEWQIGDGPDINSDQRENVKRIIGVESPPTLPRSADLEEVAHPSRTPLGDEFCFASRFDLHAKEGVRVIENDVIWNALIRQVSPVAGQNQVRYHHMFGGFAEFKIRDYVHVHAAAPCLVFATSLNNRPSHSRLASLPLKAK